VSQHAAGLAARFSIGRIAADRQQTNQSGAAEHAVIEAGRDADSGEQWRLKEFRHKSKRAMDKGDRFDRLTTQWPRQGERSTVCAPYGASLSIGALA